MDWYQGKEERRNPNDESRSPNRSSSLIPDRSSVLRRTSARDQPTAGGHPASDAIGCRVGWPPGAREPVDPPTPTGSAQGYEMITKRYVFESDLSPEDKFDTCPTYSPTHLRTYSALTYSPTHPPDAAESNKLQHFKNDLTADRRRTTRRLGAESNGVHHATIEVKPSKAGKKHVSQRRVSRDD
jgi:hypothetical protein